MNLKEVMDQDVMAVFLNAAEFAEVHNIDGKPVLCVIASDEETSFDGDIHDAVFVLTKTLYCRESDLAKLPTKGKQIKIDDETYLCISWHREGGMMRIEVAENAAV